MVGSVVVREGTWFASFGGEEQCRWIRPSWRCGAMKGKLANIARDVGHGIVIVGIGIDNETRQKEVGTGQLLRFQGPRGHQVCMCPAVACIQHSLVCLPLPFP